MLNIYVYAWHVINNKLLDIPVTVRLARFSSSSMEILGTELDENLSLSCLNVRNGKTIIQRSQLAMQLSINN